MADIEEAVAPEENPELEDDEEDVDSNVENAAADVALEIVDGATDHNNPKLKRFCRHPGCTKVIKSQGHCQRHGAKAKRCRVEGCEKQAQGTHDGMCKKHWKATHFPDSDGKDDQPPPPEGDSVYDSVLPQSIAYRPGNASNFKEEALAHVKGGGDPFESPVAPLGSSIMPLVAFLREGASKEAGWHRNQERRARGIFPITSLSAQLESWERQLALVEILLLSGGTPYANFKDLAHAWGRERGFHVILANAVCERRGEVERKRRSDVKITESASKIGKQQEEEDLNVKPAALEDEMDEVVL